MGTILTHLRCTMDLRDECRDREEHLVSMRWPGSESLGTDRVLP
jgi:hypothetical protein